jgi:hypothetical protein
MEEVRERDAREPDPPNDIDTDHRLRDEGLLAEGGLGVFLSGPDGEPAVNSWAADRLLARAAAAHKLPWGVSDFLAATGAEQLQKLALILIRDHRPDLYALAPRRPWTDYLRRRLARDVAFVRERDRLGSDKDALRVLLRWDAYRGFTFAQLVRPAIEGRKLSGTGRERGRPRKFAGRTQK